MRAAFTRAFNVFEAEEVKESPDITALQVSFALIRDKASELDELNQRLRNLMIESGENEEAIIKEMEHADDYSAKYHLTKIGLPNLTQKKDEIARQAQPQQSQLTDRTTGKYTCFEIT